MWAETYRYILQYVYLVYMNTVTWTCAFTCCSNMFFRLWETILLFLPSTTLEAKGSAINNWIRFNFKYWLSYDCMKNLRIYYLIIIISKFITHLFLLTMPKFRGKGFLNIDITSSSRMIIIQPIYFSGQCLKHEHSLHRATTAESWDTLSFIITGVTCHMYRLVFNS